MSAGQSDTPEIHPERYEALGERLSKLLGGRSIARVLRADQTELVLELDEGTRLFARATAHGLDISVT